MIRQRQALPEAPRHRCRACYLNCVPVVEPEIILCNEVLDLCTLLKCNALSMFALRSSNFYMRTFKVSRQIDKKIPEPRSGFVDRTFHEEAIILMRVGPSRVLVVDREGMTVATFAGALAFRQVHMHALFIGMLVRDDIFVA